MSPTSCVYSVLAHLVVFNSYVCQEGKTQTALPSNRWVTIGDEPSHRGAVANNCQFP